MTHTVVGLFDSRTDAEAAMRDLAAAGFAKESIDFSNRRFDETSASAGTASTATGTSNAGVGGFFSSLFGDDAPETRNYTNAASDADAILTVQTDSNERAQQIAEILDRNGAIDVDERNAQYQQTNYSQSGGTATTQNTASTQHNVTTENRTANTGDMTIPVIEEELQVGKRAVETGGVRVRSRIIEKPIEEHVRLREEHVVVNRHPVNRAVTDADMANFNEGDIEITERAEQAVISKQARVVEEVEVGKQVSERDQVVSDTVKRTDVEVEEINTTTDARRASNS